MKLLITTYRFHLLRRDAEFAAIRGAPLSWRGVLLALLLALNPSLDSIAARASDKLTPETVNTAELSDFDKGAAGPNAVLVKIQVLLDRANISPGVIDGWYGENVRKALQVFQAANGLASDGEPNEKTREALEAYDISPVLAEYTIGKEDVAGPFAKSIPATFEKMAKMKSLPYTGVKELLAEKFHMDQDLLQELNPRAEWKAGETIVVAQPGGSAELGKITRIDVDKKRGGVLVYGEDDRLIAFYPATIGSRHTPSPSGTYEVRAVAPDPVYYYLPDVNPTIKGQSEKRLKIPPGPNNPVGSMWIDLTRDTFGIHGSPRPAKIDKKYSHGCVRLTNWDAEELGNAVEKGTPVAFLEQPASMRKIAAAAEQQLDDESRAEEKAGIGGKKTGKDVTEPGSAEPGSAGDQKNAQDCLEQLAKLDLSYSALPPIQSEEGCGADSPIKVKRLSSGVKLRPAATLNCPMVKALTAWVDKVLVPAAKEQLNARPQVLYIGGSYECRGRNRQPDAKMSEHSFANAIDVMGIGFKKRDAVFIKERQNEDADVAAFQRELRTRACEYFTTVLGPSTDEPHKDHLHFDLRRRENDYKICQ